MFNKIVSSLPYSPASVAKISKYRNSLEDDLGLRKLGMFFVSIALIIYAFSLINPPQNSLASSQKNDVIIDASSLNQPSLNEAQEFITNSLFEHRVGAIYRGLGLEQNNIESTHLTTITPGDYNYYIVGRQPSGHAQEVAHSSEGVDFFLRPMRASLKSPQLKHQVLMGTFTQKDGSQKQFGIHLASGNPFVPPPLTSLSESAVGSIVNSVSFNNQSSDSQRISAGDSIQLVFSSQNTTDGALEFQAQANLHDVFEYAQPVKLAGGSLDGSVLNWPSETIEPNESSEKTVQLRVLDPLPATPQSLTNAFEFDGIVSVTFGNTAHAELNLPLDKNLELLVNKLPSPHWALSLLGFVMVVGLFMVIARNAQMRLELDLVKRDFTGGLK